MKKVLFLTRLYHPHIGGVEKHVQKISQTLSEDYSITIITEQFDRTLKLQEEIDRIAIHRIPVWNISESQKKWSIWRWLWDHQALIREADIIHIHDVFFWFLPFHFLFPSKNIFSTFHGYEGSKSPRWQAILQRKLAEHISKSTICIGDFMKKWYKAKPELISYGAADLETKSLSQNNFAIFIGRLDHDTGIMDYLKGMALLSKPIKLTVYGRGPLLNISKKYVKKHKLEVIFKGESLKAAENLARQRFAFVSRYLSILEAMQTKRLVFAHYNNAIKRDYLKCHPQAKNMVIFTHPNQLASQLEEVIKNPEQGKPKIEQAYIWAKQQTWQKLAKQYKNLWKQ